MRSDGALTFALRQSMKPDERKALEELIIREHGMDEAKRAIFEDNEADPAVLALRERKYPVYILSQTLANGAGSLASYGPLGVEKKFRYDQEGKLNAKFYGFDPIQEGVFIRSKMVIEEAEIIASAKETKPFTYLPLAESK